MAQASVGRSRYWKATGWGGFLLAVTALASLFNVAVTNALGSISEVQPTVARPLYGAFEQHYVHSGMHEGTHVNGS